MPIEFKQQKRYMLLDPSLVPPYYGGLVAVQRSEKNAVRGDQTTRK